MPIYQIKLIKRQPVGKDTFVLYFEKPPGFTFVPGQYGGFTLIKPIPGNATRRFSFLSTPADQYIAIATRIQPSPFKQALLDLAIGDEIKLAGPTGSFILHQDQHIPAVLIAGGIGIAPFYSMIQHAAHQSKPHHLTLFYGNETIESAAFLQNLTDSQKNNKYFNFIPTLAKPESTWQGETGYINHHMIKKHISNIHQPIYYICGSLNMVNTLKETLLEMDIPAEQIKSEDFPGY